MKREVVIFIDGENFLFSIADILKVSGHISHKSDITKYSIEEIIQTALKGYHIDQTRFYAGKIIYPRTSHSSSKNPI